jgi:hypothetical protein
MRIFLFLLYCYICFSFDVFANNNTYCSKVAFIRANIGFEDNGTQPELKDGEKYTLKCASGYALFNNNTGKYQSTIEVVCDAKTDTVVLANTNIRPCIQICNISSVFKLSNNVDLQKSTLLPRNTYLDSFLVEGNSKIQVVCKEGYGIAKYSNQNAVEYEDSYEYSCNSNNDIKKCTAKKAMMGEFSPPTSNIKENFETPHKCYASSLININAKIVGASGNARASQSKIKEIMEGGTKLQIKCEDGYSFTNAGRYQTEFEATCNGETGFWDGLKSCSKMCDAKALITATTNTKESLVFALNESLNPVELLISKNTSGKLYTEKNTQLRVYCNQGYEIRSTGLDYYDTTCIDGANFSLGNYAPKCELEIKTCNNNEIVVNGILDASTSRLKNSNTTIGTRVNFVCEGDTNNAGRPYFAGAENLNGAPYCIYDEQTGQSKWSHKTFNCFNGCIAGNTKLKVGDVLKTERGHSDVMYEKFETPSNNFFNISRRHYIAPHIQTLYNYNEKSINSVILGTPDVFLRDVLWLANFDFYRTSFFENDLPQNGFGEDDVSSYFDKFGNINIATKLRFKNYFLYCSSRQQKPTELYLHYQAINMSVGSHQSSGKNDDYDYGRREYSKGTYLMTFGGSARRQDCSNISYWDGNRGQECYNRIDNAFKNKNTKSLISVGSFRAGKDVCNEIIQNFLPNPSFENCKGWLTYAIDFGGFCHAQMSDPFVIQLLQCKTSDGDNFKKASIQNEPPSRATPKLISL